MWIVSNETRDSLERQEVLEGDIPLENRVPEMQLLLEVYHMYLVHRLSASLLVSYAT